MRESLSLHEEAESRTEHISDWNPVGFPYDDCSWYLKTMDRSHLRIIVINQADSILKIVK